MSKEITSNIANADDIEMEEGDTELSIMEVDGNIIIVDQTGRLVKGTINCMASTTSGKQTTATLTCYAHKRDAK